MSKNIFILGMGQSGCAAARLLCKANRVLLTDVKCEDDNLIDELRDLGINVIITNDQADLLNNKFDLLVKNPGIKSDNETVKKAKKLGIKVINEMELAFDMLPASVKIVGITGSNGKTTTSYLTYEILKLADLPVHLGGNMGKPLCSLVSNIKENDILVLEVSSHQLVDFDKFKTDISVLTNLSECHLDFFGNFSAYKKNKLKIFNHHTSKNIAILNNCKNVRDITGAVKSKKLYFSLDSEEDCYIKDDNIYYQGQFICEVSDVRIKGSHNLENVMCAIMIAKQFNVSNLVIREALANFSGVEHRMEFAGRINEREFYNDSKATNNRSTIVALDSFSSPVILILGGLDRGQNFNELDDHLNFVKNIVCYGETKSRIYNHFKKRNIDVTMVDNLEEAVKLSYNLSEVNDTILFSPACASWDQFNSFEERGDMFKEIVESLE